MTTQATALIRSATRLLYRDDFSADLSQWHVEQMDGGQVRIADGRMDIDDAHGCTVWFKQKLDAPVLIEYEATIMKAGGPNDNVSDLNCFWMAIDPECPKDIFKNSDKRPGRFADYNSLRLYYVGYGGNRNTTTRFRRYTGTDRPLLTEHDLQDPQYLLQPNKRMLIQVAVSENRVCYARDGEIIFDVVDDEPYHDGWFGIRTVNNHMSIEGFRVYRLAS